jgi:hypothetical protein
MAKTFQDLEREVDGLRREIGKLKGDPGATQDAQEDGRRKGNPDVSQEPQRRGEVRANGPERPGPAEPSPERGRPGPPAVRAETGKPKAYSDERADGESAPGSAARRHSGPAPRLASQP